MRARMYLFFSFFLDIHNKFSPKTFIEISKVCSHPTKLTFTLEFVWFVQYPDRPQLLSFQTISTLRRHTTNSTDQIHSSLYTSPNPA